MSSSEPGETFLNYQRWRYLWLTVVALVGVLLAYLWCEPIGGHHGSSSYGYVTGVIATVGIAVLMWYGIRKRSYSAHRTTLKGWLAVHVWLGAALLLVVPLHSGFSFGINVHTLAYALMVVVILSGFVGAGVYLALPSEVRAHRGQGAMTALIERVDALDLELQRAAAEGPTSSAQLIRDFDSARPPSVWGYLWTAPPSPVDRGAVAQRLAALSEEARERAGAIIVVLERKRETLRAIWHDARALAWLRLWLFAHLPMALALVLAVIVHIITVLYFV